MSPDVLLACPRITIPEVSTSTGAFCFPRDIPQSPTIMEQILFDPPSPSTPHGAAWAWINTPAIQIPPAVPWHNSSHANTFVCLKWQFGTEIIGVLFLANYPAFALPNLHGEQPIIAFSLGGIVCLLQPHKLQMEPNSGFGFFFFVNMENNKAWRKWSVCGC